MFHLLSNYFYDYKTSLKEDLLASLTAKQVSVVLDLASCGELIARPSCG
jgi:hypothetical protein